MSEIIPTTNNLKDIVDWLKNGDIVCIHTKKDFIYYSKNECEIMDQRLIYVDVQCTPDLLLDGEWPYYIENEGFVRYTGPLPSKKEYIYRFCLNY